MRNLLQNLENQGKLKKQQTGIDYINDLLYAAFRNLKASEANLVSFEETAFKAAYDGLLQISRAVLLINGYRPDDGEQHKTTFEVASHFLGPKFVKLIQRINFYRVTRNNCIYNPRGIITRTEAENILKTSKDFWGKVRLYLKSLSPQLELFEI
ncbi:hypothetical protein JW911_03745 [Candidatus Peregrinibacteria bacterium]|nr:hypothetical protein [Candidatus Peregrinibacteria bacterium]